METCDDYPTSLVKLRNSQEEFENQFYAAEECKRNEIAARYIAEVSSSDDPFIVADLGTDSEWINTSRPLVASDLRGRVVVLDFFTFCCINCQHILPIVKHLEQEFPVHSGLLVVGVHSAKFDHEKELGNVSKALMRLGIIHPVVNDAQSSLWKRLKINCWPTLVVLGPSGQALLFLVGEGAIQLLIPFCRVAMAHFLPSSLTSLPLAPGVLPTGMLRFPAKTCATETRLIIADTGHHRIVITDHSGKVLQMVGGSEPGYQDGPLDCTLFNEPNGVQWRDPHFILVADTGNHAIREVNLENSTVSTLAGTGQQGEDTVGGHLGQQQPLNSPWDICLVDDIVFIAMAGLHQIWAFFLRDEVLFGKRTCSAGTCVCIAGSGAEGNRNNSYPLRATFAQPSGLCFQPPCSLYIADSESSSVRVLSLKDGTVKNVVGGGLDPTDLFCFGDADGVALDAKLQHPLGVAWNTAKGKLYVADSYNHKIREVDVEKRLCKTFVGGASDKTLSELHSQPAKLNEPGGLCTFGGKMYIADTNNHCVKVVDLDSGSIEVLAIAAPHVTDCDGLSEESVSDGKRVFSVTLSPGGHLCLRFEPPAGLATGAPNRWKVHSSQHVWTQTPLPAGTLQPAMQATAELTLHERCIERNLNVQVTFEVYICKGDVCEPHSWNFCVAVSIDDKGPEKQEIYFSKDFYV
ncbi:NHL repeat-containing protein 2 [Dermacentor albipictus]|uniref:NHL repeat-containing protein 2 n=1 Tax=Dermacentor albipictus TaxID=60249 RepID=UPI0031FC1DE6